MSVARESPSPTGVGGLQHRVDVPGGIIAAETHDSDASSWITLIHGGFVARPTWAFQLPAKTKPNIARVGRVLALDCRGYGLSTAVGDVDFGSMADDVLAVMQTLGIRQSTVVGFSMGGFTALEIALRAPEAVSGLILEGCGIPSAAVRGEYASRASALRAGAPVTTGHIERAFSPAFADAQHEVITDYAALAMRTDASALVSMYDSIADWKPNARLADISCPVELINGEHDGGFDADSARGLADLIPGSRTCVVPKAGHTVHMERAPGFNYLVDEFVDQTHSRDWE